MIPNEHGAARRREFLEKIPRPVLLFAGGERPRNYPDNALPYRADSNFLFFFPDPEVGAAALFDPDDGTVTLFLPERTVTDALWMGPRPSFEQMRESLPVDHVHRLEDLEEEVARRANGRSVDSVAVADPNAQAQARRITGADLEFMDPNRSAPLPLQRVLAELRHHKRGPELDEMRRAALVSGEAFAETMAATRAGGTERGLLCVLENGFARRGGRPGFQSIVTVRGEVLHNQSHGGTLTDGDLVLVDAGAEVDSGYGADITRTWPASGRFSAEQRDVYELVLAAQAAAIEAVKPGVRYRNVHDAAARVIAGGLVDLGLLRGRPDTLLEVGAHALFFPHGVGHLIGLDTHDLESFGDRILYAPGRSRSAQFGTAFLRIDVDLAADMVVTIEPGIYFVPGILRHDEFRREFRGMVDFEVAERYLAANDGRGFGGIRIEDDVLVTPGGPEVLTDGLPKAIDAVEAAVGKNPL